MTLEHATLHQQRPLVQSPGWIGTGRDKAVQSLSAARNHPTRHCIRIRPREAVSAAPATPGGSKPVATTPPARAESVAGGWS